MPTMSLDDISVWLSKYYRGAVPFKLQTSVPQQFEVLTLKHALRNPLTAACLALSELETRPHSIRNSAVEPMKELQTALVRMTRLIDTFSTVDTAPVAAATIIEEAVAGVSDVPHKHRIHSLVDSKCSQAHIANSIRVRESLVCVLHNALRAAGPDGYVDLIAGVRHGIVFIIVCDSGAGMNWIEQRAALMPAVQWNKHGWGIGLSFVRQVIERECCGSWSMYSKKYGGTVVKLSLPCVR
jgi:K+-sensing histidine kinase KdpD